jgi:hypothetical protein
VARFIIGRNDQPMNAARSLAAANLEWCVPLEIDKLRGADPARLAAVTEGFRLDAGTWVQLRVHESSEGLTTLACVLAALAFRPGGVSYLGLRWRADGGGQAAALKHIRRLWRLYVPA